MFDVSLLVYVIILCLFLILLIHVSVINKIRKKEDDYEEQ